MPDRPIIFSAPMVRALLDGRKVQHRMALKPQPSAFRDDGLPLVNGRREYFGDGGWQRLPYAPGDRLWVREAWSGDYDMRAIKPQDRFGPARQPIWYWADTKRDCGQWERPRSPILMPRWASRITLTVTDVRVQRVQEISEDDARAEGVDPLFSPAEVAARPELDSRPMPWINYLWHGHHDLTAKQIDAWPHQYSSYAKAVGSFSSLWEKIHGPGAWDANPWVCALTFTVRKGNIDHD